jgi:hypothetical protein
MPAGPPSSCAAAGEGATDIMAASMHRIIIERRNAFIPFSFQSFALMKAALNGRYSIFQIHYRAYFHFFNKPYPISIPPGKVSYRLDELEHMFYNYFRPQPVSLSSPRLSLDPDPRCAPATGPGLVV